VTTEPTAAAAAAHDREPYTLRQMAGYTLKLGAIGFGGPIALVGYMQRDLVERRRWLRQSDYDEGLALAQLAPGPLAAQLAIYLGYVRHGSVGAAVVGTAFVLPSLLIVLAFSALYVRVGGSSVLQAVFYTVGAAVIGLIARSAQKLTVKQVGREPLLIGIWAVLALTTIITERESITLVVLAGLLAWLLKSPPRGLPRLPRRPTGGGQQAAGVVPLLIGAAPGVATPALLGEIGVFFLKAGAFVFGSGLAIVPFLFGGVVVDKQWLTEQQFLDAVAVALITPGPVVITTAFIGYLVAGLPGGLIAAAATFLPCYFFTVVPAPFMRRYGQRPAIVAAVKGVTAAATGAIAGAVVVLGQRSIVDPFTLAVAAPTYLTLWKATKVPEPAVIAFAAMLGLLVAGVRG
jgi:chromate transporter